MCGILSIIRYSTTPTIVDINKCHNKLIPRGPDKKNYVLIEQNPSIYLGFTRLSIMDTSDNGLQPFKTDKSNYSLCNGEIYEFEKLLVNRNIKIQSGCDCEIILPLYEKLGFEEMINCLDGEFAMVIFDEENQVIYAARDRYGVRPLFYGWNTVTQSYGFASELKALHDIMEYVEPLEPSTFLCFNLKTKELIQKQYYDYSLLNIPFVFSDSQYIKSQINNLLTLAVKKRLCADRPIGFLLSGGLDSSLIVAIACKLLGPESITCFSIGLPNSPDVIASKIVANYLGITNHHIIPFDIDLGINLIEDVIRATETYDITTIRASVPQYIMAKYISENTNIKVLLSGEGSDEIHGSYRYFRDAPNSEEFHLETIRLLKELYMYDNLRTDRTMAAFGLEVRVPFLDFDYVKFINKVDPKLLMYSEHSMEKYIIRSSFPEYLPNEILYRSKEAFSDAVSSDDVNWFKSIQLNVNKKITKFDVENNPYTFNKPKTPDALFFRQIFNKLYPGRDNVISHYWLPKFQLEEVNDPSATVLKCY